MSSRRAHEQATWFGTQLPTAPSLPALTLMADADPSPGFARLWSAFMSARVLIALALLGLQLVLHVLARPGSPWLLGTSVAYALFTIAVRVMGEPRGPGRAFDSQWLPTVGVDLLFFSALQLQPTPSPINYTPLLALPVLMAAIMGTRALALGTAALVTLMLLGHAAWAASGSSWANTAELLQAGLTGAGLLVLALLTNQMAMRLAREEALARRNRVEAHVQAMVNAMVIEALPDGVLVIDTEHLVRAANPAARLMLGSDLDVTPPVFSLEDNPAWGQLKRIVNIQDVGLGDVVETAQGMLLKARFVSSTYRFLEKNPG